uniref:Intraflagellar transport protein 88 homolog n=1 Tax=Ditylenchus dipsaci TaxID=166011 RepID=A0A915D2D8_9BILA
MALLYSARSNTNGQHQQQQKQGSEAEDPTLVSTTMTMLMTLNESLQLWKKTHDCCQNCWHSSRSSNDATLQWDSDPPLFRYGVPPGTSGGGAARQIAGSRMATSSGALPEDTLLEVTEVSRPGGSATDKRDESLNEKVKKQEAVVNELLKESIMAYDLKDYKMVKSQEAGRKERATVKFRANHSLGEPNLDLTLVVLLNLAQQHLANNMPNEALHVYHAIVKNKAFANAGRLKNQIAEQHWGDLVKLGKYEDALTAFEDCLDANGDYDTALNLILAAYCLEDAEKMREAFQRLVDIPLGSGSSEVGEPATTTDHNDSLDVWERKRKQLAERTILIAAKIISQSIAESKLHACVQVLKGYAWCVECIKQSVYASLATELEMNKAVDLLKQGQLDTALQALLAFKEGGKAVLASAAANNLSLIYIMKGKDSLPEASQYSQQALSLDRYNANALVNTGNIHYLNSEYKLAQQYYREALQVEASSVQAIYNLGLVCRELGEWEQAKQCFYKLNEMLLNCNVQVLTQLASLYHQQDDLAQALELYTQANNLAPTDPAILLQLANIYDQEGDKSQAFQCHYDSYRYFPPNIEVIKWLGNYYLYAQFAEKAVNYFEKAALMEPNNIEWHLLIASCQRRSGNFQRALQLYKQIHRRFPNNVECLKFLVQLCKDLRMPEEKEYAEKLKKLEKVNQLRMQRESDSGQGNRPSTRHSAPSQQHLYAPSPNSRPSSSRNSLRNSAHANTARLVFDGASTNQPYKAVKKDIDDNDLRYKDPVGDAPYRPTTTSHPALNMGEIFDNDDILEDDLLPE